MGDFDAGFDRLIQSVNALTDGITRDFEEVGEAAADLIVSTTLAGIAEDDQPFQPYSAGYQALIDSVGGKPGQVVNMRGLFYHDGQKRSRGKVDRGQGRRAYIDVQAGGRSFTAMTPETRPQRGLNDPLSEMSRDLFSVEATHTGVAIAYDARENDYMLTHHYGEGKMPQRKWFSVKKAAITSAIEKTLEAMMAERIRRAKGA